MLKPELENASNQIIPVQKNQKNEKKIEKNDRSSTYADFKRRFRAPRCQFRFTNPLFVIKSDEGA